MAKIRRLGGLTDATVSVLLPAMVDPVQPIEEVAPWPGSSSETSPARPPKSAEPKRLSRPKRARTTGALSASTEGSAIALTGITSGPATDG